MLKRYGLFFLMLIICFNLQAQLGIFSIDKDTGAIYKEVHSIKQFQRDEFIITDIDKAIYKTREVITVLDKEADYQLSFVEYTSSFSKLEDAQITVYNSFGFPVKTYTKKDFNHRASFEGLVADGEYYYLSLHADQFPLTVEFQKTVRKKGLVGYPAFHIQKPGQAVKHAEYSIAVPQEMGIRYYNQATDIVPEITEAAGIMDYTWKADSIPAKQYEEGIGDWSVYFPAVLIAPNKFKLDNYAGNFDSWQAFGKWYYDLGKSSLDLTDAHKADIRKMVENINDPREKIRVIYSYLQDNFRYVSIQLGIGGFRSFPASTTYDNRYGDCKALSNFMKASLDAVGIKSYQALINSGANKAPVNPAFPIDLFDHVILCVPFEKDSLWLECTSKNTDFGVLGSFTENRNALLITEDGGVLVSTPKSTAKENGLNIKAVINLKEDGSGDVHSTILSSGEYKQTIINELFNESLDEQKSSLISLLYMPAPDHFEVHLPSEKRSQVLTTSLNADFEKIPAFTAGKKMFLHAQWHRLITQYLPKKDERTMDYFFAHPFEKHDTTIYELPAGFTIESIPAAFDLTYKYGEYHSHIEQDKTSNRIISISSLVLNQQKIPAADFMATKHFFGSVVNDEIQKIVVRKE